LAGVGKQVFDDLQNLFQHEFETDSGCDCERQKQHRNQRSQRVVGDTRSGKSDVSFDSERDDLLTQPNRR
jgi:hypothetical protein